MDVEARFKELERRLDEAESRLDEPEQRLKQAEAKFNELERRLGAVESQCDAVDRFILAVIDSHPAPETLLGMVDAVIGALPSDVGFPGGQARRQAVLGQLNKIQANIRQAAWNLAETEKKQAAAKKDAQVRLANEKELEAQRQRDLLARMEANVETSRGPRMGG